MRNKALPKLLKQIANGQLPRALQWGVIFVEAAGELEKLDKIEELLKTPAANKQNLLKILNDNEELNNGNRT